MKYISTLHDGMHVSDVYLCKSKILAVSRNGKEYFNLTLQDKTGQIDAKVWEPNSAGIREFEAMDFIRVDGSVTVFNNANQLNINRLIKASEGEYDPADYFPVSDKSIDTMMAELKKLLGTISDPYLYKLLYSFFNDSELRKKFQSHSAAKSVHHSFIGGLLEHSLSVAKICDFAAGHYDGVNRELLITGALLHDIGKLDELTAFPTNDYTDEGQLLGHIFIGANLVSQRISQIEGFPKKLGNELVHLILSHHGELEYGSPKKPALIEAVILSFADNMDAKVEIMKEALAAAPAVPADRDGWLGFNRLLDSNIRRTASR